jgi:glycosyltransferase involved in cell wall biosynthesis
MEKLFVSETANAPASVSLVIPSYNRGKLIGATLDSALAQRRPFLEIIVVDDGSTDETPEVLARYGDKIRFVPMPHAGVQAARNRGVELARGDYICLCDSDDLLEPDYLETNLRWLGRHPAYDAVYCNFVTFNNDGTTHADKFSLAPPGWFSRATEIDGYLCDIPDLYLRTVEYQPLFPSGSLLRKDFYQRIGGYDTAFAGVGAEDWEFALRVVAEGRVALCKAPLVRIRKHEGNDSADGIKTVRGTADILDFALRSHPAAQQYKDVILKDIDSRRVGVFDAAFASGQFDTAAQMLGLLRTMPQHRKFKLKVMIMRLPPLLRQPLWRLTT